MATDVSAKVYSGTAVLVLFEPSQVAPYAGEDADWCNEDEDFVRLANAGLVVPIPTGMDGSWLCRVTTGELDDMERSAVLQSESRYVLQVSGHELVLGGLEALPIRGEPADKYVDEFGTRIPFEPGRYRVTVHRLIGQHEAQVQTLLEKASRRVPAYVIVLKPLSNGETLPPLDTLPHFSYARNET